MQQKGLKCKFRTGLHFEACAVSGRQEQSSGKIEGAEYLPMKCCKYSTVDHFCISVHLLLSFGLMRNLCRIHKDQYIKCTIRHNFFSQHSMHPFCSFKKKFFGIKLGLLNDFAKKPLQCRENASSSQKQIITNLPCCIHTDKRTSE